RALIDEFPSVSREAVKPLTGKVDLIGNERLWEIFCSTSYSHVKRNVLSLFERAGKWDSVYFLVSATADSDEKVTDKAKDAIGRWLWRFNRTFPVPTPTQLQNLRNVLEEHGAHVDDTTRRQLWFCLKGF